MLGAIGLYIALTALSVVLYHFGALGGVIVWGSAIFFTTLVCYGLYDLLKRAGEL